MSGYDLNDFLRRAETQRQRYDTHRQRFESLAYETKERQDDLGTKQQESFVALANALLPDLTDEGAALSLAGKLGLPEVSRFRQEMQDRITAIDARVQEIETSDTYTNRDLYRLQLETHRNELQPLYNHTRAEWEKLQSQEKLPLLVQRGFGTEEYPHRSWWRFFNTEFLDDWRCADAAVEALGVPSFAEVRVAYNDRSEQMQVFQRSMRELEDSEAKIAALEHEREQLLTEREGLPQRTYRMIGERLAAQLAGNSPLVDALPNPDAIRSRLREIDGREHQREYLDGLRMQVEREAADIAERAEKLHAEQSRYASDTYRYRNKRFTAEQWDKRFGDRRTARYEPLYERYRRTGDTVYVFNNYDRAPWEDGIRDFLWWDVITDGRLDGNFLPEVQEWRDSNPDYRWSRQSSNSYSDNSSNFDNSEPFFGAVDTDPS